MTVDHLAGKLLPHHQALIHNSAISPEVALARGYWSAIAKDDLRPLGFAEYQCLVPALAELVVIASLWSLQQKSQFLSQSPCQTGKVVTIDLNLLESVDLVPSLDQSSSLHSVSHCPGVTLWTACRPAL